jgi:nitroreductase
MDLYDAINTRRSIRRFEDTPVPREVLSRIAQAGIEAPTGCNKQLRHFIIVDDEKALIALDALGLSKGAPACIVIVMDPTATPYGAFWMQDASAAMENMLLAAVAEGLGACWIEGQVIPAEDDLRALFGVPDDLRVWSLLPVGVPAESPARPPKPTFDEMVSFNQFKA